MTPAYAHISLQFWSTAGILPTSTVGTPGAQGPAATGVHGIGVRTPSAAEVAEATDGLDMLVHMANGKTFRYGTLSMMLAAGVLDRTRFVGSTLSVDGAVPNEHIIVAPVTATRAMSGREREAARA